MVMLRKACGQLGSIASRFKMELGAYRMTDVATRRYPGYRSHQIGFLAGLFIVLAASQAREAPTPSLQAPVTMMLSSSIECAAGYLSIKVIDISMAALLDAVARRCGLTVLSYVALEQKLSMEFNQLSLEQGLRRILRDRSYMLQAETLWVLPQGEEKYAAQPLATKSHSDASVLQSTLRSGNSEDRELAAMILGMNGQGSAVAPLREALNDSSLEVREAAILSLGEIGGIDAAQALTVALRDNNPRIREQVVDALGSVGGPVALEQLQRALRDDVGFVRQAAQEMLDQLKSKSR